MSLFFVLKLNNKNYKINTLKKSNIYIDNKLTEQLEFCKNTIYNKKLLNDLFLHSI